MHCFMHIGVFLRVIARTGSLRLFLGGRSRRFFNFSAALRFFVVCRKTSNRHIQPTSGLVCLMRKRRLILGPLTVFTS